MSLRAERCEHPAAARLDLSALLLRGAWCDNCGDVDWAIPGPGLQRRVAAWGEHIPTLSDVGLSQQ